jgi:hypothetical protein
MAPSMTHAFELVDSLIFDGLLTMAEVRFARQAALPEFRDTLF